MKKKTLIRIGGGARIRGGSKYKKFAVSIKIVETAVK